MKRVFYLSTCSTCQRIIKGLSLPSDIVLIDIKKTPITEVELDFIVKKTGSISALFSKNSMKYKSMGLALKQLSDQDLKELILEEYTFLKRPLFVYEDFISVGNSKEEQSRQLSFFK
jgi:arsenate reductase